MQFPNPPPRNSGFHSQIMACQQQVRAAYLDVVGSGVLTEPRIRARQVLLPKVGTGAEGLFLLCCKVLCRAACEAVDSPPPQILL